jgi:hypothetical protein
MIFRPLVETPGHAGRAWVDGTFSKIGVYFQWASQLFPVGRGHDLDLGAGNQLKLVVEVVSAASQRSGFVLRLMASAYIWHVKGQRKVNVGHVVEFGCQICRWSDGTICGHR